MKQFFLVAGVTLVSFSASAQKPKTAPAKKPATAVKPAATATSSIKSSLDSFSYALGVNIANNLKQQGITNVSAAAMQQGMNDVFGAKTLAVNEQECNGVIQRKLQANASAKSDGEKAAARAFLEANKKRKGVTTLPSGLQYEVITSGDANSARPTIEDTVVAHYAGTLTNGKEFDNSYKRGEPLTIPVGGVIRGWTEALQLMHIGDKWKVYIPSELGYGDRGAGADIPGGAALVFEMELLGIKPAAKAAAEPK